MTCSHVNHVVGWLYKLWCEPVCHKLLDKLDCCRMLPTLPEISDFLPTMQGDISSSYHLPSNWVCSANSEVKPSYSEPVVPKLSHWPTELTYYEAPKYFACSCDVSSCDAGAMLERNASLPLYSPPASPQPYTLPQLALPEPSISSEPNVVQMRHTSSPEMTTTAATTAPRPAETTEIRAETPVYIATSEKQCDYACLETVEVELENEELWKKFYEVGNEMLVTKPGRLMFPVLRFKVNGLEPNDLYKMAVAFNFVDEYRHRFSPTSTAWKRLVEDKVQNNNNRSRNIIEHSTPAACGSQWTSWPVSFENLKLTSSLEKAELKNMIYLPTMRKYRVELLITKVQCVHCHGAHTRHIHLPLTEFVAVTSYNNVKVKKLKIENNPHAKYLRDEEKKPTEKSTEIPKKNKRTGSTQTNTRTNKKRRRENTRTSATPVVSTPNKSEPYIQSFWSKSIEPSPANSLKAWQPAMYVVDLTKSIWSRHQENGIMRPRYTSQYGNELAEYSYTMATAGSFVRLRGAWEQGDTF